MFDIFTGSDSSSDLASITKMLDATNPTNFRNFFNVSEDPMPRCTPDLIPIRKVVTPDLMAKEEELEEEEEEEEEGDDDEEPIESNIVKTVTQEKLTIESRLEKSVILKRLQERCITPDQSTQDSDTTLAARKSMMSPTPTRANNTPTNSPSKGGVTDDQPKKKRNSYADSPHKLTCPYCPRAFPWISSLNRHILTHTGKLVQFSPFC